MCYFQKIQTFNFQFSERKKMEKKNRTKNVLFPKKSKHLINYLLCAKRVYYFNQ